LSPGYSWVARRGGTGEAKCRQVQLVDERIHDPDQVVRADIVIAIRKQQPLPPDLPLNKAIHTKSPGCDPFLPFTAVGHQVFYDERRGRKL
jgi:hypothetical protein